MKAYYGGKGIASFLTSTLDGDEQLTSRPGHLTPGKEPR
jgi:hypothetical protein